MAGGEIRMKESGSEAKTRPMTNFHPTGALPNTAHDLSIAVILLGRFPGLRFRRRPRAGHTIVTR